LLTTQLLVVVNLSAELLEQVDDVFRFGHWGTL